MKKKLPKSPYNLVLDIDETLVRTFEEANNIKNLKIFSDPRMMAIRKRLYELRLNDQDNKRGSGKDVYITGIARPHYREFLEFANDYFTSVIIWSAGQYPYVHKIVDYLYRDIDKRPDAVLTREDCKENLHSNGIVEFTKPLNFISKKHPELSHCKEHNTIIIDNTAAAFETVNPKNGILIPNYEPREHSDALLKDANTENAFLLLKDWCVNVLFKKNADVRHLDKEDIFFE